MISQPLHAQVRRPQIPPSPLASLIFSSRILNVIWTWNARTLVGHQRTVGRGVRLTTRTSPSCHLVN